MIMASQARDQWLLQARRSPVDPLTGRVACLVCSQRFSSYAGLAQHLGASHGGTNSENAKFALLGANKPFAQPSSQPPPAPDDESMFPALGAKSGSKKDPLAPGTVQLSRGGSGGNISTESIIKSTPTSRHGHASLTLSDLVAAAEARPKAQPDRKPALPHKSSASAKGTKAGIRGETSHRGRQALAAEVPEGLRLRSSQKRRLTTMKKQVRSSLRSTVVGFLNGMNAQFVCTCTALCMVPNTPFPCSSSGTGQIVPSSLP